MKKTNFFKKQNEKDMLDILYSQRFYYNRVNCLENLSVVLTLFICIFDFFEIKNSIIKIIVNGFMVGVNALLLCFIKKDIVKGANLKKYFDYSLFGFSGITKDFEKECKGFIYDVLSKKRKDYNHQVNNNGKSKPPGLKDWYFDEGKSGEVEVIKSMQKQNLYWDKKISKIYLSFIGVTLILLLCLYVTICILLKFKIIELLAGFIPFISIIIFFTDKIKAYFLIDKNVEVAKFLLNKAKNIDDLVEIQEIVDNRRMENFCPPNIIHSIISKNTHKKIEYINDNK